jgi:hypothetical protein
LGAEAKKAAEASAKLAAQGIKIRAAMEAKACGVFLFIRN